MKILIEESVLRQVLEVLTYCEALNSSVEKQKLQAITALRTALDAAEKVEDQLAAVTKERDELEKYMQRIHTFAFDAPELKEFAKIALAKVGANTTGETK